MLKEGIINTYLVNSFTNFIVINLHLKTKSQKLKLHFIEVF